MTNRTETSQECYVMFTKDLVNVSIVSVDVLESCMTLKLHIHDVVGDVNMFLISILCG